MQLDNHSYQEKEIQESQAFHTQYEENNAQFIFKSFYELDKQFDSQLIMNDNNIETMTVTDINTYKNAIAPYDVPKTDIIVNLTVPPLQGEKGNTKYNNNNKIAYEKKADNVLEYDLESMIARLQRTEYDKSKVSTEFNQKELSYLNYRVVKCTKGISKK
jgi:hypothetical protein